MSRAADFPGSERYMAVEVASGNGSGSVSTVAGTPASRTSCHAPESSVLPRR